MVFRTSGKAAGWIRLSVLCLTAPLVLVGCRGSGDGAESREATSVGSASHAGPPLGPPAERPTPRVGMAWVPAGALVAGTPVDRLPRVADEEMTGEQIILDGFYIDRFPFPNEEGAIPLTGVTQSEARALCEERGKRLCSELEWERACKGPDNRTYEYGERYRASVCDTGRVAKLRPSGLNPGCESDFGVRDMHGGTFEWTDSSWARGAGRDDAVALRGGNDINGELVGRCANARPAEPDTRSGGIGFRCCAGPRNAAEVNLHVAFPAGLLLRARFDPDVEKSLLAALPEEARTYLGSSLPIRAQRSWLWRPVANEELHAFAVCAVGTPAGAGHDRCGLLVARVTLGAVAVLAWTSSGQWAPTLHSMSGGVRDIWVVGGDRIGSLKRTLRYRSGQVELGEQQRGKVDEEDATRKKKSKGKSKK